MNYDVMLVQPGINFFVKTWGWEIWFANTEKYCGKELFVRWEEYSSGGKYHYHLIKDETFYVIKGTLKLDYFEDNHFRSVLLEPGHSFRIKPGIKHRFTGKNNEGCHFIEASTHHDEEDSYRCYFDEKENKWIDV